MEFLQDHPKAAVAACTSIVAFVVLVAGLAWSAGTVEPNEYALKYNTISKSVDAQKVYEGGWFVIGPFNSFITFPRTQVNLDFSDLPGSKAKPLPARSEGLPITLSFSFQYQLIKEDIGDLYKMYQKAYEENFVRVARGAITDTTSNFTIDDYWTRRTEISVIMQRILDERLQSSSARCTGFQILKIELPINRENSIITSQVANQIGFQKQYEQQASNIRAAIDVDKSKAKQQITVIQGEAAAESTRIINEAEGYIKDKTINSQAGAYKLVSDITKQTPADTLMDYIYYTNLLGVKNSTVLIGIDKAMLNMLGK